VWLEAVDSGSAAEHQCREGRNGCQYAPHSLNPPSEIEIALEVDRQLAPLKGPTERIPDGNSTPKPRPRWLRSVPSSGRGEPDWTRVILAGSVRPEGRFGSKDRATITIAPLCPSRRTNSNNRSH